MKKILFTGGTGFLGRNLIPLLECKYEVTSPTRTELNLLDEESVAKYLEMRKFDIVIHAAIPNPVYNKNDSYNSLCEDSLRAFLNLYKNNSNYEKMIYFGSGAEFDKTNEISLIEENEFGKHIPKDGYGISKYIMNELCRNSENIYNLRIFGCYGKTDADFKFLTHIIRCCLQNKEITMNQDCLFDYIIVNDLAAVIDEIINSIPKYHDYNVCSGNRYKLSEIALLIMKELNINSDLKILKPGLNREYTGSNKRLLNEFPNISFTSLIDGIKMQIRYEKESMENEKKSC